jgi:hypothetical protein
MSERWQRELMKLRRAELPDDLWERMILEGPRLEPLAPPRRSRVAAAVVAFAVFAVAGFLVWQALAPVGDAGQTLAGPEVTAVPPRGDVAAVFLSDGRPAFVAHHLDGTVSVVDAFSSHRPYGLQDLIAWCPSTRQFVEIAHEARFDEFGRWESAGPAPFGLATFSFQVVERDPLGDPLSIRVGAITDPSPGGSAHETDPSTYPPFCPAEEGSVSAGVAPVRSGNTGQVGYIIRHTVDPASIWSTPADVASAGPDGWIAVHGRLFVSRDDAFVQLCADVQGERCIDGAIVRGIDGMGLLVNILIPFPEFYAETPGVWFARVEDGLLLDIAGIYHG